MTDYVTSENDAPDELIAGDMKRVTDEVVLAAGQVVVRGEVLGRITATNKFVTSAAAATDGSEVPRLIAAEAMDATLGDKRLAAYRTGEFNEAAVTFGAGHTADSTRDALRGVGIHLKKITG